MFRFMLSPIPSRLATVSFSFLLPVTVLVVCGQAPAAASQTPAPATQTPGDASSADGKVVGAPAEPPKSKAALGADAWKLLTDAVTDDKHVDLEIDGLSALGTMGSDPRSTKMIVAAFSNKEVDVRTAAILAAGQTRNRAMLPALHKLLDDKEPQVAFTAAVTLWKMGDHSGGDLLTAVIDGDRKASASLMGGAMHSANRELHDPAALAKLGAMQGASMLLGPFGFGITAYEYVRKNGGDSARVTAIELIAQTHTATVRKELIDALADKDPAVRAAAAKAVRAYRDDDVCKGIAGMFNDSKRPVQMVAAASYLIASGAVAMPLPPPQI